MSLKATACVSQEPKARLWRAGCRPRAEGSPMSTLLSPCGLQTKSETVQHCPWGAVPVSTATSAESRLHPSSGAGVPGGGLVTVGSGVEERAPQVTITYLAFNPQKSRCWCIILQFPPKLRGEKYVLQVWQRLSRFQTLYSAALCLRISQTRKHRSVCHHGPPARQC